ncbi:MAG TPA: TetR/AcrR family transcriptional regulator [Steroidobacteraceae bacterium]|jgi:AcrR family transcriptional regulator|nr:TetR/AcrR family transcriptional regulator [Steroidobacteraceae bacterium]
MARVAAMRGSMRSTGKTRSATLESDGEALVSPWPVRKATQRNHDLKREAVIRAAARAFNARGYHNTSIEEIAAGLNVTKPTIYYYVANKEQLLLECVLTGLERVREPFLRPRPAGVTAREHLNSMMRHYAETIASEYGWCMVRAEDLGLAPISMSHIKRLKSEIDQGIRRLLEEGMRDGSIQVKDLKMASFALAGAFNWIAHWYRENQSMTAGEIAEAFIGLFDHGLAPRATQDLPRTRRTRAARKEPTP